MAGGSDSPEPPPAARLARHFSSELVLEARVLFARRLGGDISETEARAMLAGLTGFIRLLTASTQCNPNRGAMLPDLPDGHDLGGRTNPG